MPHGQTSTLVLGDQEATVDTSGGRAASYRVGGRDVLDGIEIPAMFAFRGSLLAPWPNRVAGGRWSWQGRDLDLTVNDDAAGAALHGLVYDVEWSVEQVDSASILLGYDLPETGGYPFPLRLTVAYELGVDGLACALTATNVGSDPAPVGLGVHPYLAVPGLLDDLVLTIAGDTVLETDESGRLMEPRPAANSELDFRTPRQLGESNLDVAYTDLTFGADGRTEVDVQLPDGATVVVWGGRTCRWWQVYTAHTLAPEIRRRSFAVEPMTCPPNALNTGEIDVVAPGESLRLEWGFSLR
jgi:aldose 1-epimerase